jgi:osmotically-inducible protein OsmY
MRRSKITVLRGVVANPSAFVANLDVRVEDGVVVLAGSVRTRRARQTVEALAKSVPGVSEVRDHLTISTP